MRKIGIAVLATLMALVAVLVPATPALAFDETVYTSDSDGLIKGVDAVYATARDAASGTVYDSTTSADIGQIYTGSAYGIYRCFLFFDTSSIPDGATISAATLSLYGYQDFSTTDFDITVQTGGSTYPHDPLVSADYNRTYYSSDGGTLNTSSWSTSGYNDITLNATGRGWINKEGWTKFALRSSRDINNNTPTGWESVRYWVYEAGEGYRPKLIITYAASSTPSVTTNAASSVTMTTARLNSYLNNDGGEPCDIRFEYDDDVSGAPYTYATDWVNDTYLTGDSPYADIGSLTADTTHYFRVQARNSQGTVSGSELNFTTEADVLAPSDLIAVASSGTTVELKWTKGSGASETVVRRKLGEYPSTYTDGDEVYVGEFSACQDTGVVPGMTYYYRAWGKEGEEYSGSYAQDLVTTPLSTVIEGPDIGGLDTPGEYFQEPDPSGLEDIPGEPLVGILATSLGFSEGTMWVILMIFSAMVLGIGTQLVMHRVEVAIVLSAVAIVIFSIMGVVPLWIMFVYVIIAVGLAFAMTKM